MRALATGSLVFAVAAVFVSFTWGLHLEWLSAATSGRERLPQNARELSLADVCTAPIADIAQ